MRTWIRKSRFLPIVGLSVALPLALSACGSLDDDGGTSDTPSDEEPSNGSEENGSEAGDGPTIVNVPKLVGEAWFDRMEEGVDKYAADHNVNYYMQGPGDADANAQVRVMNDLLTSGVDALTVVPFQPDAVEQVQKEAMDDGVIIITHEAPNIENAHYDLEAFQNADYGRNLMDELAKGMDEEGQYALMVGSLSSTTHMDWVEAAKEYQEETYPNMEHIGDIIETNDDSQQAYEQMQELLSAFPDIKGVQGSASTDVVGVGQAVDEAGLNDKITVVGTSVPNDARSGIKNGSIDAITFWDPADAAYAMGALVELILADEEITDGVSLGVEGYESITLDGKVVYGDKAWVTVTADNVDDYDF